VRDRAPGAVDHPDDDGIDPADEPIDPWDEG
jgi:hypothetical protein